MTPFIDAFLALLSHPALLSALLAIGAAGVVRGFAGFGGGMIFMPFATILFDPRLAVVAFFVIDSSITLPLVKNALAKWDWRTVVPCALGSWIGVQFGAFLLATTNQLTLRWVICLVIIALVVLMASGWRYTKRPVTPISLGVGLSSGVLGGISQVSAPPLVAYWASGPSSAATVRANLITFFFFATLGSLVAFWSNGVFTWQTIALAAWLAPAYGVAIFAGARAFKGTRESVFRKAALALILLAAVTSLPLLDPLLRG